MKRTLNKKDFFFRPKIGFIKGLVNNAIVVVVVVVVLFFFYFFIYYNSMVKKRMRNLNSNYIRKIRMCQPVKLQEY